MIAQSPLPPPTLPCYEEPAEGGPDSHSLAILCLDGFGRPADSTAAQNLSLYPEGNLVAVDRIELSTYGL
jgi:hypothetical protein